MIQWKSLMVGLILAGLFAYAGGIKMIHPDKFLADVESYRMMPYELAWLVSLYLPPLELVSGLALLVPMLRKVTAGLLLLLMGLFVIAIAVAWTRGLDISCGCFGSSKMDTNYVWLIFRDLLIIAGLVYFLKEPIVLVKDQGEYFR